MSPSCLAWLSSALSTRVCSLLHDYHARRRGDTRRGRNGWPNASFLNVGWRSARMVHGVYWLVEQGKRARGRIPDHIPRTDYIQRDNIPWNIPAHETVSARLYSKRIARIIGKGQTTAYLLDLVQGRAPSSAWPRPLARVLSGYRYAPAGHRGVFGVT